MRAILFGGGLALLISLLGTRVAINLFTKWGYGQEIRDDGPTSHHTKRGTPTMGGVVIILATVVGYFGALLITQTPPSASALLLLFLFVGMGLVGFLDDYIKISKQRSLGLRSKAKMIGQTLIAVVFGGLALSPWLEDENGVTPASQNISFLRDISWLALPMGLAVLLIWLIIVGTSNGVNLTDGLDGLATGACTMVFAAYMIVNIWQGNQFCGGDNHAAVLRRTRSARPRDRLGGAHRSLLRLPVVERVAGPDLHGRHRIAVARRRARRSRDPDPHRAAPGGPRRALPGDHAVGDDPGRLLQALA